MKNITSRMTFSSFGGFFAGPARCATAIVREDDYTGPGGGNADTELLDVTIGAGKKLAVAIEQELSGRSEPEIFVPVYPLTKRRDYLNSGLLWFTHENRGVLVEEDGERTDLVEFLLQSAPVDGALAWLYGNGLGVLEEIQWLCSHRRAFSAMILHRVLFELSCNAEWISAPDSNARAASFWKWVRTIVQIKSTYLGNQEETDRRMKKAWWQNKSNRDRNSFCNTLEKKAEELGRKIFYTDIYGLSSDVVHGHHFWVLPTSELTGTGIKDVSVDICRDFVLMARATAENCGISDKWPILFGEVERHLEEEIQRRSDALKQ